MSKEKMSMRSIRIAAVLAVALSLVAAAFGATSAFAAFGVEPGSFDGTVLDQAGQPETQAGAHPFVVTTGFTLNSVPDPEEEGQPVSDESNLRNAVVHIPAGLLGNPRATPRCSMEDFLVGPGQWPKCPDSSQVGIAHVWLNLFGFHFDWPGAIYNLEPASHQPALFGFYTELVPTFVVPTIRNNGDYGLDVHVANIDETLNLNQTSLEFWGVPASPEHDMERGMPGVFEAPPVCSDTEYTTEAPCPSKAPEIAFLTNPTDCAHGPFTVGIDVQAWAGQTGSSSFVTHDNEGNPTGVTRCDRVPFGPTVSAKATTSSAETPTGLDFELSLPEDGILNPEGLTQAEVRKAVVRLPRGMSLNPSAGEGLGVCTPAEYAREDVDTAANQGCPNTSKLGSVSIKTPLLEEGLEGSVYLAQPDDPKTALPGAENPFDSLISIYIVARNQERGIVVKSAGEVRPDEETGQIVTTFDDLPQLPFSNLKVHFREGQRSPIVSPPNCGSYQTVAELTPWSSSEEITVESTFLVTSGVGGEPCPSGGTPPFHPQIEAGTLNNNAGSYSPFYLRMFRSDSEQEITNFSADLPPGLTGKLAGIPKCSDAELAQAAAHTGLEEKENPSCPAASQVGHALVGYGVGSILNYSPGKVYLAGPYHGTPVSIATVTSALIGPFDVGTVIVRSAFRVDPETAQIHVDSKGSDPIPHIRRGILLHLRDIRLYLDRSEFVTNPTSCDPMSEDALITGSGADFASSADDAPISVSEPFQVSNCGLLPFKPKLSFRLRGGTHRGDYPALTATLKARPGDANIRHAAVVLPHTEFLEQAHIGTVCTRVQYAANECPAASIYGHVRAVTPLLDHPLEGNVYMRSSSHPLPDLVASLRGEINIDLAGRIQSKHGQIATIFDTIPDTPVTKFVLSMKGGKKGLLVNSRNLCLSPSHGRVSLIGQNSKTERLHPVIANGCAKGRAAKRARGRH